MKPEISFLSYIFSLTGICRVTASQKARYYFGTDRQSKTL